MGTMVLAGNDQLRVPKSTATDTHERRPTPRPDTMRPTTMTQKPGVKVWIAPPTAKMTAPKKRVPRLPMMSPTRPAATEVTAVREDMVRAESEGGSVWSELTECADLKDGYHGADLQSGRVVKVLAEVRASNDPRHDAAW